MPFDDVEIVTKENKPPEAVISYMRPKKRGKAKAAATRDGLSGEIPGTLPELTITLPTTMFISKARRFRLRLQVGSGAHAGLLRIVAADEKDKNAGRAIDRKHCCAIRFGHVPKLGEEIFQDRGKVEKVDRDTYEIEVPSLAISTMTVPLKKRA